MAYHQQKLEKVTFNLPSDLKNEVVKLKESLSVSLNTIYKTAIAEYVEKQEIKRWERGARLAAKDKNYMELSDELGNIVEDVHEY
jgi:hypothetical protein